MSRVNRNSRPCTWVQPRNNGGLSREHVNGPLLPMSDHDRAKISLSWIATGLIIVIGIVGAVL